MKWCNALHEDDFGLHFVLLVGEKKNRRKHQTTKPINNNWAIVMHVRQERFSMKKRMTKHKRSKNEEKKMYFYEKKKSNRSFIFAALTNICILSFNFFEFKSFLCHIEYKKIPNVSICFEMKRRRRRRCRFVYFDKNENFRIDFRFCCLRAFKIIEKRPSD